MFAVLVAPAPIATAGTTAPPRLQPGPEAGPITTNPFIPENVNIGDCVSSVPRPGCGDDQRSGYHQYLTFLVLFLATVVVFWRVFRAVRARDRAVEEPQPKDRSAPKV